MRNVMTAVMALGLVAGANAGVLNLWVTQAGDAPGTGAVLENVEAGDVLTLWAEMQTGDQWIGINFDIDGHSTLEMFNENPETMGVNFNGSLFPTTQNVRWARTSFFGDASGNVGLVGGLTPPNHPTVEGLILPATPLAPFQVADVRVVNGVHELGTITAGDVNGFLNTTLGFARFGGGDSDVITVAGTDLSAASGSEETATLWTPEPASLVLIGLAALAIRRR